MYHSSLTHTHTSMYSSHVKVILKTAGFSKGLSVLWGTLVQQIGLHGRRQYGFYFFPLCRQASLGLPFLLMSCHAVAFQGGNMFLCRRQSRQASGDKGSHNQIRHLIKSSERPEVTRSRGKPQWIKQFPEEQSKRLAPGGAHIEMTLEIPQQGFRCVDKLACQCSCL